MRVVVTGAGGMLAHDLLPQLREAGHDVTALKRADLDVTDPQACRVALEGQDAVVNAAAWTAVDAAQEQEAEAFAVNADGPANLARAAQAAGAKIVQVSTDYVFAGDADEPYAEDAPTGPRSAYGRTKLAGEWAVRSLADQHYVVRTAWLYGAGGGNFLATMARLSQSHETLDVVDDQVGQPTWTGELSRQLVALLDRDAPPGVYHGTSSGRTSWFGLTRALFAHLDLDPERVRPTTAEKFPRPAPRPAWSVLGHRAWADAGVDVQPDWEAELASAMPALGLTG